MFLQGGAALQFAMIPLNFGTNGAYIDTGVWSSRAIEEANIQGTPEILFSGKSDEYKSLPDEDKIPSISAECPLCITHQITDLWNAIPLYAVDHCASNLRHTSSDFISRPLDVARLMTSFMQAHKKMRVRQASRFLSLIRR